MPRSPYTRFCGLAIVAAYFLILLWPDQAAQQWGWHVMMSIPVVIGLFTWFAVRDAPPLDDQAFHRTLPPGDGHAFWRVLIMHGLVLIGIALAVVVYCWVFNFGWQAMSYGVLALALPVWGIMAAHGIAASLATSRQFGKSWGYIAIFAVPVFTLTAIYYLRGNVYQEEVARHQYLNSFRTMAMVAALLYPLIWWLVAVGRRKVTALVLGSGIGVLIPCIYVYGGFITQPEEVAPVERKSSHIVISRKEMPAGADPSIPLDSLFDIKGLREGEIYQIWSLKFGNKYLDCYDVPSDPDLRERGSTWGSMLATLENGKPAWGEFAVWRQLYKQIPGLEELSYWHPDLDTKSQLSIIRPGEELLVRPRPYDGPFKTREIKSRVTEEEYNSSAEVSYGLSLFRLEKSGEVDASKGGSIRLSDGGLIEIGELENVDGNFKIPIRLISNSLAQADGPWFKFSENGPNWGWVPWIIAVDETGRHSYALSGIRYRGAHPMMLGNIEELDFAVGEGTKRGDAERLEILRHCRLHIFSQRNIEYFRSEYLLPK